TREISHDRSHTTMLLWNGLVLKILLSLLTMIAILLATVISGFDTTTRNAILLTMVSLGLSNLSLVFLSAFQAHQRMLLYSFMTLLNDIGSSLAIIFFIRSFPSITTVLVIGVVVSVIYLSILLSASRRLFGHLLASIDRGKLKRFLSEGYPLALTGVGGIVNLY